MGSSAREAEHQRRSQQRSRHRGAHKNADEDRGLEATACQKKAASVATGGAAEGILDNSTGSTSRAPPGDDHIRRWREEQIVSLSVTGWRGEFSWGSFKITAAIQELRCPSRRANSGQTGAQGWLDVARLRPDWRASGDCEGGFQRAAREDPNGELRCRDTHELASRGPLSWRSSFSAC